MSTLKLDANDSLKGGYDTYHEMSLWYIIRFENENWVIVSKSMLIGNQKKIKEKKKNI